MKTRFIKSLLAMVLTFFALPILGQDCMEVFFKDGTHRKFYLRGVTEITTSQYDASGVRHSDYDFQLVKTPYYDYVYNLAEIDSIAFTKFDEEKTRQDFSSAMTATIQSLSECESIGDAEKMLGQIKAAEGVEDAWSDGCDLYVKINRWETISFHFNHNDDNIIEETENTVRSIREMIPQLKKEFERNGRRPRFVIANQEHYDNWSAWYYENKFKPLLEDFSACGFDTCYLAKPTLDFFATEIFKYDFIFLITHGGYSNKLHGFVTGERLGEVLKTGDKISQESWDEWMEALIKLNENTKYENSETVSRSCNEESRGDKTYWVGHPIIRETFFDSPQDGGIAEGTFPTGSILFSGACHSMDGYDLESSFSMAKKFTDRNLGIFYGYSGSNYRGPLTGYEFYNLLLKGKATGTAYVELPESLRVEKDKPECAVLTKYAPEGHGLLWIGPLVTHPLENSTATEEYTLNNKLVLSATMTTVDPNAIDKGFLYGTQKHTLSEKVYSDHVMKTLNFGEGNYLYSSAVTPLEQKTNYFYCAFTYDGINYHYGDTLKFCIGTPEQLKISVDKLNLTIDEAYVATVNTGSGKYLALSDDESVATVSVDGKEVTIEAVGLGPTTITVTDIETEQTGIISIDVTKVIERPSEPIDMGLPSGTKWAAYNVGATKPEEFGGFYAWGEIIENGKYDWDTYLYGEEDSDIYGDLGKDISGTEYDVAHVRWGGEWRMPTHEQFKELIDKCSPKWIKRGEVQGMEFTGLNGAVLFLPAAGYFVDNVLYHQNASGGYWSSTLWEGYDRDAFYYNFGSYMNMTVNEMRYIGHSIRPIINGTPITLQKLELSSTDPVSIFVGESATVGIISGNGQYDVKSSTPNLVSAKIQDNTVVIESLQSGETTITVIDVLGDYQVSFTVTIMERLPDLVLSTYDPITMNVSAGATFMINSGSGSYAVESSDETVATVKLRDKKYVDVSGVATGTAIITVIDTKSSQKKTIEVTIIDNTPLPSTPAEAIDLGLPSGTKWASYNLGATRPEDFGGYYAWGEVGARSSFEWEAYQYYNSSDGWMNIGEDIGGTGYDAARKLWGDEWRMPSATQFRELKDNCTIKETEVNGVYGRMFTGKNGNSIFLPAGGSIVDNNNNYMGNYGYYWSSTLSSSYKGSAQSLFFKKRGELMIADDGRANGVCVRPVTNTGTAVPDLVLQSTEPLNLKTRQNTSINVISGSGSYTAKSDDESVATADISDWVSLETGKKGKCVNVNAVGVGLATVTVTDVQSLQQVSVKVTVTQNVDLLKLSVSSLELKVGETGNVMITASSGAQYAVATSDASVATFSIDKTTNTIKVLAVGAGTCNITVNDSGTGETAAVNITVTEAEAVDLGLSVKWSKVNVGATSPEEHGGYYAWGETKEKGSYSWANYTYCNGSESSITKYNSSDGKTTLDLLDDAAYINMGMKWRTPTKAEMDELKARCKWTLETINGKKVFRVTGPNGNYIFLPLAGHKSKENWYNSGSVGYYSVSTLSSQGYAPGLCCYDETQEYLDYARYLGMSIRPVLRENIQEDTRLETVVPNDLRKKMEKYMPIYDGKQPPKVEGVFKINPFECVFCEDYPNGGFAPGYKYGTDIIKFTNFDNSNNTLDYEHYFQGKTEFGIGPGAYISGNGNLFTIYFIKEGENKGIYTKTASVLSGEVTTNGLKNVYSAFLMLDKGYDPNNGVMKVGYFRVYKDGDGLSEPCAWGK